MTVAVGVVHKGLPQGGGVGSSQYGQMRTRGGDNEPSDVRTITVIKCNDTACCGQRRSSNNDVFLGRFLPTPVPLYNYYNVYLSFYAR